MRIRRASKLSWTPETPLAKRLEQARAISGAQSLLAFHELLTGDHPRPWTEVDRDSGKRVPKSVSYGALKKYHFDFPAPLDYLERVAEVTGVRLEWLATNSGGKTEAEERERTRAGQQAGSHDPVAAAVLAGLDRTMGGWGIRSHLTFEYRHLSAVGIKLALALIRRGAPSASETYRRAGAMLGECIMAPVTRLQATFGLDDERHVQAYVTASAHAVEILAHYAMTDTIDSGDQAEFDEILEQMAAEQAAKKAASAAKRAAKKSASPAKQAKKRKPTTPRGKQ